MSAEAVEQQQIQIAESSGAPSEGLAPVVPVSPLSSPPDVPQNDIVIKRAEFGDETSATDITKTLTDQLDEYGYVDVTAGGNLIPSILWGDSKTTRLEAADIQYAEELAIEDCGGAQNKSCVEIRKQQHAQKVLREKADREYSSDKIVKGRRLTVTYIDAAGREQTVVVPDGNQFKIGSPKKEGGEISPFSTNTVVWNVMIAIGTLIFLLGWVYSVVATYRTLIQAGFRMWGYVGTALAILFPYSGFLIMLVFFAITAYTGLVSRPVPA
jgi:hypothetical protein